MNKINQYYFENKNKINLILFNLLLILLCLIKNETIYTMVLFSIFHISLYIQLLNLSFKKNVIFIHIPLVFLDTFYILYFNFNIVYIVLFFIFLCSKSYLIKYYNSNINKDIIIFYDIIYIIMKIVYIFILIKIY